MKPVLEVCCGDIASVRAAAAGGAFRVELCSALGAGGVTPSAGFMAAAAAVDGVRKHALIRPREGDFVYSADEVEAMRHDISLARTLGLDGVVIGALCHDGSIDTDTCKALIEVAEGMSVTFHRAFDLLKSPFEALEQLIGMGVDRILTSGLAATALDGSEMLRGLQKAAGDKLIIMPGCGVKPGNAAEILRLSGCREIHASARGSIASEMTYRRTGVSMGTPGTDEYSRMTTDASEVRAIVEAIESLQIV